MTAIIGHRIPNCLFVIACTFFTQNNALATTEPTVREWFALGSGCRAKHDAPGDVSVQTKTASDKNNNALAVLFSLPLYALSSDKPIKPNNPTFARECALRASLAVPAGKRIRSLSANIPFLYSKDTNAKLRIAAQMHAGNSIVDSKISEIENGTATSGTTHNVGLFASTNLPLANASGAFPPQECGADKLVGLDLSLTNWRDSLAPKVHVAIAKPHTILLQIEFESCKKPEN